MTAPNIPPTESVWDYPRPPRLEPTSSHLRIVHRGVVLADTTRAVRILETSHPPVYYIPPADIALQYLQRSPTHSSFCEFKGHATYWTIDIPPHPAELSSRPERNAVERPASALTSKAGAPYLDSEMRAGNASTRRALDAAWSYPNPTPRYAALRDHLAFYANRVDECTVDGERVQPQPGDFYGGWITSRITGPFKGPPGTMGW